MIEMKDNDDKSCVASMLAHAAAASSRVKCFHKEARRKHVAKEIKTTRPAAWTQTTLILGEELHFANRIRDKLPPHFPFCFVVGLYLVI